MNMSKLKEKKALFGPLFSSESPPVELSPAMRKYIHQKDRMLESLWTAAKESATSRFPSVQAFQISESKDQSPQLFILPWNETSLLWVTRFQ